MGCPQENHQIEKSYQQSYQQLVDNIRYGLVEDVYSVPFQKRTLLFLV